jgi:hypothetical protein
MNMDSGMPMKPITTIYRLSLALLLAASVTACGTDSSSSGGSSGSSEDGFSLRVTDAPFDDTSIVQITFVGVRLKQAGGGWIDIPLSALSASTIDLAQLQGSESEELVGDYDVPAGDYTEMRLIVDESRSKVVETLGAEFELKIPSGEIKIKGDFTVSEIQPTLAVADLDLRQSLKKTGPFYNMQSPVVRLVVGGNFGHARGMVDSLLLITPCSDTLPDTFNSVYVFEGHDIAPDDIDNNDPEPVTTSKITFDLASSGFKYEAAFLPPGEYTIAFTCNANLDTLDNSEDLMFFGTKNITIKVNDILFL